MQPSPSIFFAAQQHLYNYALSLHLNSSSRFFEQSKPSYSYIGLIAMAILSSPERQLVLADIYQWILDRYPYFQTRSAGWRNSIRHNLSLNACFIKSARSSNGKGHYWRIHPASLADFLSGDFRRRRAQCRARNSVDEIACDSKLGSRKRCFDVDSLLAPDHRSSPKRFKHESLSSPNSQSSSSTDTHLST